MTEREKILGRVREALKVPAPVPGHEHHDTPRALSSEMRMLRVRECLPAVGATFEARLALFQRNATELKADFYEAGSEQELATLLLKLSKGEGWKTIGAHRGELTDTVCAKLGLPVCQTDAAYDIRQLEACDAGITECDALIAQTGSVLLTARSAGGRALSVLPPHHVVLAQREQVVGDLPDAFALLKGKYGASYPSFISFITGPSRTGDIERILVLGAHGPKKLTIYCV